MKDATKELSSFSTALLSVWLYAPTALVGATLTSLAITSIHPISEGIAWATCLFFATLLFMAKVKTLETKYEPVELLDKMKKFGGGLVLPVIVKDTFNLVSGRKFDVVTNLAIDLGFPLLVAPYSILFAKSKQAKIKL